MLSLEPIDLLKEIHDAERWLKPFHSKRREMIRKFAGPHYRQDENMEDDTKAPENYPFAYTEFVKPQIVFGMPACTVSATAAESAMSTAQALQVAINHWIKEQSWKQTLSSVVDDAFFGFGVTKCGLRPRGDYGGQGLAAVGGDFEAAPNWPFAMRIPPRDFIIDAQCMELRRARIMGHSFERDLDDVKSDESLDPQARDAVQQMGGEPRTDVAFARPGTDRKRVKLWEVYLPEHARVSVLAEHSEGNGSGVVLSNEPYLGPDEGPYTIWGLASVPDELMPISPIQALWDQFLEVNTHSRAAAKSASTHKKLGVYEPSAKEDSTRIKNARNGQMIPVKNIKAIADFEIGGASPQQLNFISFVRDRLDRNLGFGDAQRGSVGRGTTATEANIANSNSDLRTEAKKDRIGDCVVEVYRKIGWYFFNEESIGPMTLSRQDQTTGRMIEGVFQPGRWQGGYMQNVYIPPEPESDFTEFALTIVADTMGKQDDPVKQKRAQDEWQMAMGLMQMGLPVNIRRLLDRYGEAFNVAEFSKIVLLDQTGQAVPLDPLSQGSGMPTGMPGGMGMPGQPGIGQPMLGDGMMQGHGPPMGMAGSGSPMPDISQATEYGQLAASAMPR